MRNRVTIVEAVTGVNHQAGACSATEGRLEMIKADTEHVKAHKRQ